MPPPAANSNGTASSSQANGDTTPTHTAHGTTVPTSPATPVFGIKADRSEYIPPREIRAATPFHTKVQPSYLSASAAEQDFRGLYNLAGIILVTMNARLVIENLVKYGWLISPTTWLEYGQQNWSSIWPSIMLAGYICISGPIIAYVTELLAARGVLTSRQTNAAHILHTAILFLFPQLFIVYTEASFVSAIVLMFATLIFWLKLVSYAHVSNDLRREAAKVGAGKKSDDQQSSGSKEPTVGDKAASAAVKGGYHPTYYQLAYFILAPTLIYQPEYPRTERIRIRFCIRRLIELAFCLSLQVVIVQQYIVPIIQNAMPYFNDHSMDGRIQIAERVLKLAIPNAIAWLLMFYGTFHSALNLSAELLRFGDRNFYDEWWNSQDLGTYWRTWNKPVHHWVQRHLYAPMVRSGYSKMTGQLAAFTFSALFHELLISVPTRMLSYHAFLAMMGQVPLIMMTQWLSKSMNYPIAGNLVFWVSFLVFGQPLIILVYCFDLYEASSHNTVTSSLVQNASLLANSAADTLQSKAASFFAL